MKKMNKKGIVVSTLIKLILVLLALVVLIMVFISMKGDISSMIDNIFG
ncbi:MAG: hypothetical protein WC755_03405 [Candidatus Woesearchaeota archaeon]|jgi:hypothetical protein